MLKLIWNFINYWYFRYLLVTELYMVEKWERVMIHIAFGVILLFISLFNCTVVIELAALLLRTLYPIPGINTNFAIRNEL